MKAMICTALLVSLTTASAVAQHEGYPSPLGLYCSCPPTNALSSSALPDVIDKDYVHGVLVRVAWSDLAPQPGVYNWELIDEQLTLLEEAGKTGCLAVINGRYYPSWLEEDPAFETFHYLFRGTEDVSIPVPWNEAYLQAWKETIAALGQRYDNHPSLRLIRITHATSNGMEFQLPQTPSDIANWTEAEYSHSRHLASWVEVVDAFGLAFPTMPLDLDFHPVNITQSTEGFDEDTLSEEVYQYAVTQMGPRFGALAAWWSRKNSSVYSGQYKIMQQSEERAFATTQFVGSSHDHWESRFDAASPFDAAVDTLEFTLDENGIRYLELWNADLVAPDDAMRELLEDYAAQVSPPQPPTGLAVTATEDRATLNWEGTAEAITYNVYKRDDQGVPVLISPGQTATHYQEDTDGFPGTYAITAVDSEGRESWFSEFVSAEAQVADLWLFF